MDDATQKLVDDARADAAALVNRRPHTARTLTALADALEAAQRPPVAEPDNHHNADVCPFCTRNRDEREAAIRAEALAQRPPVSPEQREAVRAVVGEQLTRAGLDIDGPPFADDGETQWPVALELRDRMTDAILARFSLPVLDAEKVAQWLMENFQPKSPSAPLTDTGQGTWAKKATALVASLHTLTTDGTPADTERSKS